MLSFSEWEWRDNAPRLLAVGAMLLALAIAGCGGSESDTASPEQLEAARSEGEERAREQARVDDLHRQVQDLRKRVDDRKAPAVAPAPEAAQATPAGAPSSERREAFHAPSGNVSCEILSDGAICTVVSADLTFSFADGEAARVVSGSTLGPAAGRVVPYGGSISLGTVTCEVPASDEPRGVTCTDSSSGHGFEASRFSERQRVY